MKPDIILKIKIKAQYYICLNLIILHDLILHQQVLLMLSRSFYFLSRTHDALIIGRPKAAVGIGRAQTKRGGEGFGMHKCKK